MAQVLPHGREGLSCSQWHTLCPGFTKMCSVGRLVHTSVTTIQEAEAGGSRVKLAWATQKDLCCCFNPTHPPAAGRGTVVPKRASGETGLPPPHTHPPTKFKRSGTVQAAISPTLPSCKSPRNRAKVPRLTPPASPRLLVVFRALEC